MTDKSIEISNLHKYINQTPGFIPTISLVQKKLDLLLALLAHARIDWYGWDYDDILINMGYNQKQINYFFEWVKKEEKQE